MADNGVCPVVNMHVVCIPRCHVVIGLLWNAAEFSIRLNKTKVVVEYGLTSHYYRSYQGRFLIFYGSDDPTNSVKQRRTTVDQSTR